MRTFTVYTDGACIKNPGPGGWSYITLVDGEKFSERSGTSSKRGREATNNQMEILAVCKALESLPAGSSVAVYSDSTYVVRGFSIWAERWSENGWMTKNGPVKNQDLWNRGLVAISQHERVLFQWIHGHNGNRWNEMADNLAQNAAIRANLRFPAIAIEQG